MVEFLRYPQIVPVLNEHGIVEAGDDARRTFTLTSPDAACVHFRATPGPDDPAGSIRVPLQRLTSIPEEVLLRLHVGDVALIPVGTWRSILDAAAFALAKDEKWLTVDAEASMHQNSRDPLAVTPKSRHIIGVLLGGLIESGADGADHELHLLSLTSPLVLRLSPGGRIDVWCPTAAIAERVASVVNAA